MKRSSFADIIKGFSILLVVFTHYAWQDSARLQLLFPFWVQMAVPFFMMVSGFVFSSSFSRKMIISWKQAYAPNQIIEKLLRYSIPFAFVFMLQRSPYGRIRDITNYRNQGLAV